MRNLSLGESVLSIVTNLFLLKINDAQKFARSYENSACRKNVYPESKINFCPEINLNSGSGKRQFRSQNVVSYALVIRR